MMAILCSLMKPFILKINQIHLSLRCIKTTSLRYTWLTKTKKQLASTKNILSIIYASLSQIPKFAFRFEGFKFPWFELWGILL